MTEISSSQPQRRSLRSRLVLPGLFFLGGIGAAGWFVSSTETGRNLISRPAPAISVDAARLTQPVAPLVQGDLIGRIAELEARLARAEAAPAGGTIASGASDRATGLVLAFAARRALERGQPLGAVEGELTSYFGEGAPHLIAAISSAAKQPVTLEQLRTEFETISATLTSGGENWWSRLSNGVTSLVSVRDAADAPEDPKTVVARAGAALDRGSVAKALKDMEKLPNASAAADWISKARRYSAADIALTALEVKALEGRAAPASATSAPLAPPVRVIPEPSI